MNDLLHAFEILNVDPGCDDATLRKAWRALVRTYHPDMAKSDPKGANARLAEINAAWDMVSSSTADDVARARETVLRRRRQENEARQARVRAAFKAAEGSQSEKQAATGDAASDAARATGGSNGSQATKPTSDKRRRIQVPASDMWAKAQITKIARQAFQSARIVCSNEMHASNRSLYM